VPTLFPIFLQQPLTVQTGHTKAGSMSHESAYFQYDVYDSMIHTIIPDILSPKTTRAFWRQNNFNINKPAPLGAKLLGAFHWKCSTPFYS
jgi:hypothetical protein